MPIRVFLPFVLLVFVQQKMLAQWDTLDFQTPTTTLTTAGRIDDRLLAGHPLGISYSDDFGENWLPAQAAPVQTHSVWTRDGKVYASNVRNGFDSTWISNDNGQSFEFWGAISSLIAASKVIRGDSMYAVVGGGGSVSAETVFRWIRGNDTAQPLFTCPGFAYNLQIIEWQNRLVLLSTDGIRWSDDNGLNWQQSASIIPINNQGIAYDRLLVHGNSLFYYNRVGQMLRSDDGGATWNNLTFFQEEGQFLYIVISEGNQLLASGPDNLGDIINWRSSDHGATWEPVYPEIFTNERIFQSYPTPAGKRLLTSRGCFAISADEASWETRQFGFPISTVTHMLKTGPEKWVIGENYRLYFTDNNGRTFRLVETTPNPFDWEMHLVGNTVLINLVGAFGFMRSDDGGETWTSDPFGTPQLQWFLPFNDSTVLTQSFSGMYLYDVPTGQYHPIPSGLEESAPLIIQNGVVLMAVPFGMGGFGMQASLDTTHTFVPANTGLPADFQCQKLFSSGNHVFAWSPEYGLYTSDNVGASWTFSPGPPTDIFFWPTQMAGAADNVFATNTSRLYLSDGGGDAWFLSDVPVQGFGQVDITALRQFGDAVYLSFSSGGHAWFLVRKISDLTISKLRGRIFADTNNNQVMDAEETGVSHVMVRTGSSNYALSNGEGFYTLLFEAPGSIAPELPSDHLVSTPPSYGFTASQDSLDFALYSIYNDVEINLESGPARSGFAVPFHLYIRNNGIHPAEVSVKTILDPRYQLLYSQPTATQAGDTLVWPNLTVPALGNVSLQLSARLADTVAIGSLLSNTALVTLMSSSDDFPDNDTDSLRQTVVGSFDPNDKTALRGDTIPLAEIQLENRLAYRIRFQNTGNYPATFVRILDTLETDFDPLTFRLDAASHPVEVRFVEPRVLEFFFDHILLPDSTSDEAGSHGFVRYSLITRNNLAVGDSLTNRAGIYFDFNAPVITNTAVSVVEDVSGTPYVPRAVADFVLVPNPAPARQPVLLKWNTELSGPQKITATVYDAAGKMLRRIEFGSGTLRRIEGLDTGTYFIHVKQGNLEGVRMLVVR